MSRDPTSDELVEFRRDGCTCLPDVEVLGVDARGLEQLAVDHDDDCPILIADVARWN